MTKVFSLVLSSMFLFLICDGNPPGPNQWTHYSVTEGAETFTAAITPCPSPLPPNYNCQPGDVIMKHDLSGYGPGTHSMVFRGIVQVDGAEYRESNPVPFVYGVGGSSGPTGMGLVVE